MAKKTNNPLFGVAKPTGSPRIFISPSKPNEMEREDSDEPKGKKEGSSNCCCIDDLLEAQLSIRMQHWLTTSHAEHKALGKAYEGLDGLIDTFVETLIGAKGRDILSGINSITVGGDAIDILDDLEDTLRDDIPSDVGEEETALLNIRDEMLALVQQTKYLLTLK